MAEGHARRGLSASYGDHRPARRGPQRGVEPHPEERAGEEVGRTDARRQGRRRGRHGRAPPRARRHRIRMTLAPPRVELGAPGVYFLPDVAPPILGAEPLDVAAFVGIAPRGPAWEPVDDPTLLERGIPRARSVAVPVDSWDDYVERYGGFEGPGLLPHAVATYFAQGGRRAVIVRIVHDEIVRTPDG